jgi:polar amino acid transport system permease protein
VITSVKHDRSKPLLPFHRRSYFVLLSTIVVVFIGFLVLPKIGDTQAALKGLRLAFFSVLVLIWSANILADKLKPLWLHILVTSATIIAFLWGTLGYLAVNIGDLPHIFLNFSVMNGEWPLVLEGLLTTVELAVSSAVLATFIGVAVSVLRLLNNKSLNVFLKIYLEFFRAMPILVTLMIVYFGFPFLNLRLEAFTTGVLVLSLTNGAYISEVFFSGMSSIHHTQFEASHALGMSFFQMVRLVILPQAVRIVLPPLTNRWIVVLKDTVVCSFIAVTELLKASEAISSESANPTPLTICTGMFLGILIPLTIATTHLEKRYKKLRG